MENDGSAFSDDFSLRLQQPVLLFRWGRAHVLQLHLFVRRVVLLGVVLRVWRRVLRIQRPGHRERRRVVCSGSLHLHSGDLAITTTHHRGFLLPSQWTLTIGKRHGWISPGIYHDFPILRSKREIPTPTEARLRHSRHFGEQLEHRSKCPRYFDWKIFPSSLKLRHVRLLPR